MSAQKLKVGKNTKLKKLGFKRDGYFFKGWNTRKDGKGQSYSDAQSVKGPLAGGVTTTLYAQWGKAATTVTFQGYANTDSVSGKSYETAALYSAHRDDNGSATATIRFTYDGDKDAYKYVSFDFVDVTPPAFKKAFSDMGVNDVAPKVVSLKEPEPTYADYMENTDLSRTAELTVSFGQATRVLKVVASAGGKRFESGWICVSKTSDQQYCKADRDFYDAVRHRVESKLWKPGMTNLDKLVTIACYISNTNHYPGSASTTPENPTFWNNWSVEGKVLYRNLGDGLLNCAMRFQGGICDCWVADDIYGVAVHDLGLKGLYNKEKDEVAAGEGVWTAIGEYSSACMPGSHMSLIYKDVNEQKHYIDAQGVITYPGDSDVRCEDHGCLNYLVSLK